MYFYFSVFIPELVIYSSKSLTYISSKDYHILFYFQEAALEKNPGYIKEKANFVFNTIDTYYKNHAYKQALAEIEASRDLLGTALNVGNQLKLNKIYTACLVKVMQDTFEVDGNISLFSELMAKYHTNLELHADRNVFHAFQDYLSQKERHKSFKSRNEYHNIDSEPATSEYRLASDKKPDAKKINGRPLDTDIAKDFLDSIESPSFKFASLSDDTGSEEEVIKSNVDVKAIHDDFFSSIASPQSSSRSEREASKASKSPASKSRSEKTKTEAAKTEPVKIEAIKTETTKIEAPRTKAALDKTPKGSGKSKGQGRPEKKAYLAYLLIIGLVAAASYGAVKFINLPKDLGASDPSATNSQEEPKDSSDKGEAVPAPGPKEDTPVEAPGTENTPQASTEEAKASEYVLPSSERELIDADFDGLSKQEVRLAINEMFARYGWNFGGNGDLFDYFSQKSWYKPDMSLTSSTQAESKFSAVERINLQIILAKFRSM